MATNLKLAETIAERTRDAYSADRYANWTTVAKKLLDAGYGEEATEAIMRSKWARWAADARGFTEHCPAKALVEFAQKQSRASLRELVEGMFPHVKQARLDREAHAPVRKAQEELDAENRAAFLRNEGFSAASVARSVQGAVYTMSGDDATDEIMVLAKSTETTHDGFTLVLRNGARYDVHVTRIG